MKKDKIIEKKLNEYSEIVKPSEWVIYDAVNILSSKSVVKSKRHFLRYAFGSLFTVIISLIIIFNINKDKSSDIKINYTLNDIYKESITETEFSELSSDLRTLNLENTSEKYSIYKFKTNNEIAVINTRYVVVTPYGTDIVQYAAEVSKGNYYKSDDYRGLNIYKTKEGIDIYSKEYYSNDEYYTKLYFKENGIEYYLEIMSPNGNMTDYYIDALFI